MDNNFNIIRPSSTKEILEEISADMRRYKSKLDDVKAETELINRPKICGGR